MATQQQANTGLGAVGLLWVALIVLKIVGYLPSLSWWIVVLFPIITWVVILVMVLLCAFIYVLIKER